MKGPANGMYHSEEEWDMLALSQDCPECGENDLKGHMYWCVYLYCEECHFRGDHTETCSQYDPYVHYGTPEHEAWLMDMESRDDYQ